MVSNLGCFPIICPGGSEDKLDRLVVICVMTKKRLASLGVYFS